MREIDPQSGDSRQDSAADARLSNALHGLAASSRRGAPAELGAGLAMAFRRHHARRRLVRRASVGALAACLALAGGLISMRSRHETPVQQIAKEPPTVIPVKAPEAGTIASAGDKPMRPVTKQAKPRAATSNLASASRREFLALPGYDPAIPAEELSIVRVRVPASALWQMGAPVSPDSGARKFMADFVVSQDGTPYAVRLVQ